MEYASFASEVVGDFIDESLFEVAQYHVGDVIPGQEALGTEGAMFSLFLLFLFLLVNRINNLYRINVISYDSKKKN